MDQHYNLPWVKLMTTMRQAHPSGTKPRDYPNAPQVHAFTMDFSPGYDVGMSRYALAEGSHYDNGFNPFEPEVHITEHRHELEEGHHIEPHHLFGHDLFRDPIIPRNRAIRSERESGHKTSFTLGTQTDSNIKYSRKQMSDFLRTKNIDIDPRTPSEMLKSEILAMGFDNDYYKYVRDKRAASRY